MLTQGKLQVWPYNYYHRLMESDINIYQIHKFNYVSECIQVFLFCSRRVKIKHYPLKHYPVVVQVMLRFAYKFHYPFSNCPFIKNSGNTP